jgi:hypothetical protein
LAADKKYGRGGKAKMLAKRNTFESAHDMSDFSVKKNKNHGVAFQKDKFKPGGGKQRPGKDRRNQSKGGAGRSRRK